MHLPSKEYLSDHRFERTDITAKCKTLCKILPLNTSQALALYIDTSVYYYFKCYV